MVVFCIVGPLLDVCTLFTMSSAITKETAAAVFLSGVPVNAIHALATFLTLFLLSRPITEKLNRIKVKYGMMEAEEL